VVRVCSTTVPEQEYFRSKSDRCLRPMLLNPNNRTASFLVTVKQRAHSYPSCSAGVLAVTQFTGCGFCHLETVGW